MLTFQDGNRLVWINGSGAVVFNPPPAPTNAQVWVSYSDRFIAFCPVCGGYDQTSVEARDGPDGELLWISVVNSAFTPETFEALFGVGASATPTCYEVGSVGCFDWPVQIEVVVGTE